MTDYADLEQRLRADANGIDRLTHPTQQDGHDAALFREAADAIAFLARWREEALEVERSWDVQAIGKLLSDMTWGDDIRAAIQPAIERLLRENAELRALSDNALSKESK